MVSRKWTIQLSLGLELPIAAAQPPSAMTVCALPNSDLEMIPGFLPACPAPIAPRSPATPPPPPPTPRGSRSMSVIASPASVEEPRVAEHPGGDEPDVEVSQHQGAERGPRELHVTRIQLGDLGPYPVSDRVGGEVLQPAAGDVPARLARQRVRPQQDPVNA